jgi:hypothetical protein
MGTADIAREVMEAPAPTRNRANMARSATVSAMPAAEPATRVNR